MPLKIAERLLQSYLNSFTYPAEGRLDVVIPAEKLVDTVARLIEARWGYLGSITGLDIASPAGAEDEANDQTAGHFECLYIFFSGAAVLVLRVPLAYDAAVVPSICGLIPAATLYERELMEMFGIEVEGTPVKDRLVLADDWPKGVYPLRKSFSGIADADQR
ncbi:MAG: NADH-quinone oxidoreductase subunit C [Anaerolineae bacterium]|nr:NADH-quinone oxidoreductase subunit C [Anaerolineae bacterium]